MRRTLALGRSRAIANDFANATRQIGVAFVHITSAMERINASMRQPEYDEGLLAAVRSARQARERRESKNTKLREQIRAIDDEIDALKERRRAFSGDLASEVQRFKERVRHADDDIKDATERLRQLDRIEPRPKDYDERKRVLTGAIDAAELRHKRATSNYQGTSEAMRAAGEEVRTHLQNARNAYLDGARKGDPNAKSPPSFEEIQRTIVKQLDELIRDAQSRRVPLDAKLQTTPAAGDEEIAAMGEWLADRITFRVPTEIPAPTLLAMFEEWCDRSGTYYVGGVRYVQPGRTFTISLGSAPRTHWISDVLQAAEGRDTLTGLPTSR